jgi:hypothetical protein
VEQEVEQSMESRLMEQVAMTGRPLGGKMGAAWAHGRTNDKGPFVNCRKTCRNSRSWRLEGHFLEVEHSWKLRSEVGGRKGYQDEDLDYPTK